MYSVSTSWLWTGFFIFVGTLLFIDLFLLGGRKSRLVSTREALSWTLIWMLCALIFNAILWASVLKLHGGLLAYQKALEFFTGYVIEESLSFDNMFVILMIFNFFAVPQEYQRRVLLYGILGAIVLRFIMIFSGIWIINQFHWVLYLFGIFLIVTGIKMAIVEENPQDLANNRLLVWLKKHFRVADRFHKENFFVRQNNLFYVTPLFLVLVLVEFSDLIFALDSIPAIFAVTRDPFIVFTSNIFAILGLRAIYFLLANLVYQFHLLKYGIALVIVFIGGKMLVEHWINIPILFTLSLVAIILAAAIFLSLLQKKEQQS